MEPQYSVEHIKLHCPSYLVVQWTGWTVPWNLKHKQVDVLPSKNQVLSE